jgi:hypothetical protein
VSSPPQAASISINGPPRSKPHGKRDDLVNIVTLRIGQITKPTTLRGFTQTRNSALDSRLFAMRCERFQDAFIHIPMNTKKGDGIWSDHCFSDFA